MQLKTDIDTGYFFGMGQIISSWLSQGKTCLLVGSRRRKSDADLVQAGRRVGPKPMSDNALRAEKPTDAAPFDNQPLCLVAWLQAAQEVRA